MRDLADGLAVAIEIEGPGVDVQVGHGWGRARRDDEEGVRTDSGAEPQGAVVHRRRAGVVALRGERRRALIGLHDAAGAEEGAANVQGGGRAEDMKVERVSSGSDRATAETGVAGIGDDPAAGDGQGVQRAVVAILLAVRAAGGGQVAALEADAAEVFEGEALDGGGVLDVDGTGSLGIHGRGHNVIEAVQTRCHGHRSVREGHCVRSNGSDRGSGRNDVHRSAEGLPHDQSRGRSTWEPDGGGGGGASEGGAAIEGTEAFTTRGQLLVFRRGQEAVAIGIVGDEGTDRVAAVDPDDVRTNAVGLGEGHRRVGAHEGRRRSDHIHTVGSGRAAAESAGGSGIQDKGTLVGRALSRHGSKVDASLGGSVLGQVPLALAGDVGDGVERFNEGSRGAARVVEHATTVVEDAIRRGGLDGGGTTEAVTDGARAIQGEHAALAKVGGDETESASCLVEDYGITEDVQSAEQVGRTVARERPVAGTDLGHVEQAAGVIASERACEGSRGAVAGDEVAGGGDVEVLDDRGGHTADCADRDVGVATHIEDRVGTGEVDGGVLIVGSSGARVRTEDQGAVVHVHGQRMGAVTTELEDARALLVDGAVSEDVRVQGQTDLFVALTGSAVHGSQAARHVSHRDRGRRRQVEATVDGRDHANVVQVAGGDGVRGVGQCQCAGSGQDRGAA